MIDKKVLLYLTIILLITVVAIGIYWVVLRTKTIENMEQKHSFLLSFSAMPTTGSAVEINGKTIVGSNNSNIPGYNVAKTSTDSSVRSFNYDPEFPQEEEEQEEEQEGWIRQYTNNDREIPQLVTLKRNTASSSIGNSADSVSIMTPVQYESGIDLQASGPSVVVSAAPPRFVAADSSESESEEENEQAPQSNVRISATYLRGNARIPLNKNAVVGIGDVSNNIVFTVRPPVAPSNLILQYTTQDARNEPVSLQGAATQSLVGATRITINKELLRNTDNATRFMFAVQDLLQGTPSVIFPFSVVRAVSIVGVWNRPLRKCNPINENAGPAGWSMKLSKEAEAKHAWQKGIKIAANVGIAGIAGNKYIDTAGNVNDISDSSDSPLSIRCGGAPGKYAYVTATNCAPTKYEMEKLGTTLDTWVGDDNYPQVNIGNGSESSNGRWLTSQIKNITPANEICAGVTSSPAGEMPAITVPAEGVGSANIGSTYDPIKFNGLGVDGMKFKLGSNYDVRGQMEGCNFNGENYLCQDYYAESNASQEFTSEQACPKLVSGNKTYQWELDSNNDDPDRSTHKCVPPATPSDLHITAIPKYVPPRAQKYTKEKYEARDTRGYLLGCPYNDNYVCTEDNPEYTCPYQMPGNWRWVPEFNVNGDAIVCNPPVNGVLNYEDDTPMGVNYYIGNK